MAIALIPVVNALADVTTNFASPGVASPGGLRAVFLFCLVLLLFPRRASVPRFLLPTYVFLAYLFARSLASTDLPLVLGASYSKVFVSLVMLPIGYHAIRDRTALRQLHWALYAGGVVVVTQFGLAQFFGWGESVYVDDSFYLGGSLVQSTYYLAVLVLIWPVAGVLSRRPSSRAPTALLALCFMVFVLLVFRRGAILGMGAGILVYWILAAGKTRTVIRGLVAAAIVVAASPLFAATLTERASARSLDNRPLEDEARLAEVLIVWDEFRTEGPRHALLGSELFNSPFYFKVERQLHVDYMILLHGGGLVALLLYALFYLGLVAKLVRVTPRSHGDRFVAESRAVFMALIALSLVVSLSGSINSIGYRSALFLYLGAVLGVRDAEERLSPGTSVVSSPSHANTPQIQPG